MLIQFIWFFGKRLPKFSMAVIEEKDWSFVPYLFVEWLGIGVHSFSHIRKDANELEHRIAKVHSLHDKHSYLAFFFAGCSACT